MKKSNRKIGKATLGAVVVPSEFEKVTGKGRSAHNQRSSRLTRCASVIVLSAASVWALAAFADVLPGQPGYAVGGFAGLDSIAVGPGTSAKGNFSIAIGENASTDNSTNNFNYATALGTGATAAATNATALGAGAVAGQANDVALGAGTKSNGADVITNYTKTGAVVNGVTFAVNQAATNGAVAIGQRQLTQVADGEVSGTSTDGINGSQLFKVATTLNTQTTNLGISTASALGGGSTYNSATGVSSPSYNVYGSQTVGGVGGAITALQLLSPLQYSNPAGVATPQVPSNDVTLVGKASSPVTLHNLAAGAVLTDGVNVGQLKSSIAGIDFPIRTGDGKSYTTAASGVGSLAVGGTASASAGSTVVGEGASDNGVANSTVLGQGANIAATATSGSNVALGQGSTVVGAAVATAGATIGGTAYTFAGSVPGGVVSVGSSTNQRQITNVAAGQLNANSTDAVNGSQLFATNQQVGLNSTNIAGNTYAINNIVNGKIGPFVSDNSVTAVQPVSSGKNANAGGFGASATGAASDVVGNQATDNGVANSTVLGQGASIAATGTSGSNVALGQGSTVGAAAVANPGATIGGVAYTYAGSAPGGVVSVGSSTNQRQITNVAAGQVNSLSTDAVNGSQLNATNVSLGNTIGAVTNVANIFGGGSTYNPKTGVVTAPTYNVFGSNWSNVGDALTAVQTKSPVQYSTPAGVATPQVPSNDVTLVGAAAGPVVLHNVAAGTATTDGVNVGQLKSSIAGIDFPIRTGGATPYTTSATGVGSLAVGATALASARSTVVGEGATDNGVANSTVLGQGASIAATGTSGSNVALGQGSTVTAAAVATPNATIGGTAYTFAGSTPGGVVSVGSAGKERQITNVAAGQLSANSTDAVNGSQLYATNTAINSMATGGGIKYFHANSTLPDSQALGLDSVAVGPNAVSSGVGTIAIGNGANSGLIGSSVAIGAGATANASTAKGAAVAIGLGNKAIGDGAVSIGDPNLVNGDGAVGLGLNNTATGAGAVAVGNTNSSTGVGAVTLGNANIASGDGSLAVGNGNTATGVGAIALGQNTMASANNSLAFGTNAMATALNSEAIGNGANASNVNSTAIGNEAVASGVRTTALGNSSLASGAAASALGYLAQATGHEGLALGDRAVANQGYSVAIGGRAQTNRGGAASYSAFGLTAAQSSIGEFAIAVTTTVIDPATGLLAPTGNKQITGVAAGSQATDAVNVSQLQGASANLGTSIASILGGTTSYNPLTGTVTGGFTYAGNSYNSVQNVFNALTGGGTAAGIKYFHANSTAPDSSATGGESVAVGPSAVSSGANSLAMGSGAVSSQANSVALGAGAASSNANSVALGAGSTTSVGAQSGYTGAYMAAGSSNSTGEVSVGSSGSNRKITNVADGSTANDAVNVEQLQAGVNTAVSTANNYTNQQIANVNNNVGGGMFKADVTGARSLGPTSSGAGSAAGGAGAVASGNNSTAVGNNSTASGVGSTAIGNGSTASAANSVALGTGSVADRANSVSVGSAGNTRQLTNVAAGTAQTDAVNVSQLTASQAGSVKYDKNADGSNNYQSVTLGNGSGAPTSLHNVGAGTANTDAVNVGQLNTGVQTAENWAKSYTDTRYQALNQNISTVGSRANGGIATAMAMASLPQAYAPNQSSLAVAAGNFHGESGVAVGMSTITESGHYIYKANATADTRGDLGVGVGMAVVW